MTDTVRVEGAREVARALDRLGLEVESLEPAFAAVSLEGTALVRSHTPRRSGRLVATVRGAHTGMSATVTAGGATVPYAGAINYGWRARRIEPASFMQKTDPQLAPKARREVETDINALIAKKGLA